jgi:hypothetical protein
MTVVDKHKKNLWCCNLTFNNKGQQFQDHRSRTFQGHKSFTCVTYVGVYNSSIVYT